MKILVLMMGAMGSGKTTYCEKNLAGYVRISQDEMGKGYLKKLQESLDKGDPFIVVDRVNHIKCQRGVVLQAAKKAGYATKIVWLNTERSLCQKRAKDRTDHPTLKPAKVDEALSRYYKDLEYPSRREADEIVVIGDCPAYARVKDLVDEIGSRRHLIVGDIHGCLDELQDLLSMVGFDKEEDVLVCVGDLVDRGPKIREVIEFLRSLPRFHCVRGNHDEKCSRYFHGAKTKMTHGLLKTIEAYADAMPADVVEYLSTLPFIIKTPSGYVVHAGFDPEMGPDEQMISDCLYMRYHGGTSYFDSENGRLWYEGWPESSPRVFFGHIPDKDGPNLPHVVSLDGGCVFGDVLKAWDSRDQKVHSVPARKAYAVSEYGKATSSPHDEVRKREEYAVAGLLRLDRSDDGKLAIYNYTDQCTFDKAWDQITLNSRGHIFNVETGERVASPFPKFFNLGENESVLSEKLPWSQSYEVFDKMDGWLGVLYRQDGKYKVASRGSFHSTGSTWATEFIQSKDLSRLPPEVTLCFEIINPAQRILLNYGDRQDLVVLAAFDKNTGEEYPRVLVEKWCLQTGLTIVRKFDNMTIDDCMKVKAEGKDVEGYVIRFHDGTRVKVKADWYVQLAKIRANVTPIAIWETMKDGLVQEQYIKSIPDELLPLACGYKDTLEAQYKATRQGIEAVARPIASRFTDKKALALFVMDPSNGVGHQERSAAFCMADGREDRIDKIVMDMIYPKNNELSAT